MAQDATTVNGITSVVQIIRGITTQFGLANVPYMLIYKSNDYSEEFVCAVIRNDGDFFYLNEYEFMYL